MAQCTGLNRIAGTRIIAGSRGNSSVGRARPCQGRGREFESRFPLHTFLRLSMSAGIKSGHPWPGFNTSCERSGILPRLSPRGRGQAAPRSRMESSSIRRHIHVPEWRRQAPSHRPPARWQSGHAADCKSAYAGSIPTLASRCDAGSGCPVLSAVDLRGIEPHRFDYSRHPWRSPFGPPSAFARVPDARSPTLASM